jgi:hypothetical protein
MRRKNKNKTKGGVMPRQITVRSASVASKIKVTFK